MTGKIYVTVSREMTIINRSNVDARVIVEPSGGWGASPTGPLVLAPEEQAIVSITGDGADGAPIAVRIRSADGGDPGNDAGELVMTARVYRDAAGRGFVLPTWVPGAIILLATGILWAILIRRRAHRVTAAPALL